MAKYVDGFILVIPKDRVEDYIKMSLVGRDTWIKNGALEYYECQGNDLAPHDNGVEKSRSFAEMTGASQDDTVWFSLIVFKSKEHRDEVNVKVMAEMGEQMKEFEGMKMPFDMQKMAYGGFQVEVEG